MCGRCVRRVRDALIYWASGGRRRAYLGNIDAAKTMRLSFGARHAAATEKRAAKVELSPPLQSYI